MHCSECDGRIAVIDSRTTEYGVRRRRKCPGCNIKFTTIEVEVGCPGLSGPVAGVGHREFEQALCQFLDNYAPNDVPENDQAQNPIPPIPKLE